MLATDGYISAHCVQHIYRLVTSMTIVLKKGEDIAGIKDSIKQYDI